MLEKINENTIEVTELPIRRWTQDFKEMLEEFATGTDKIPATVRVCMPLNIYTSRKPS